MWKLKLLVEMRFDWDAKKEGMKLLGAHVSRRLYRALTSMPYVAAACECLIAFYHKPCMTAQRGPEVLS